MRFRLLFLLFLLFVPVLLLGGKPAPPEQPFNAAIVYIQERGSTRDVALLNAEGTQTKVLFAGNSKARARMPSFSPDGTKVVFGFGAALYVVPTAGGTPWKVVDLASDSSWSTATWSPDSRFLLYSDTTGASAICGCLDHDLFLIELDGTGHAIPNSIARLTDTPSLLEYFPTWSPAGTRFVAHVFVSGNEQQLWIFDFDATTRSITSSWSLTAPLGKMYLTGGRAQWNRQPMPSGHEAVIFSGALAPGDYSLWFADTVTGPPRQITPTDTNFEVYPTFSPDNGRIAFVNGNWQTDISIIENAFDVIAGVAPPVMTHTAARTGGKVTELFDLDWKPVP